MSEKREKGFLGGLFWVFVLCLAAVAALYFLVRPAELSTNERVVDLVRTVGAMSVVIFLLTVGQVPNIVPARRLAFHPVGWGLLLALTMAAALAVPVVILAFSYFSVKALILLTALLLFELLFFIVLLESKLDVPVSPYASQAPMTPVAPAIPLAQDVVAQYEQATLALEQATREKEEATMEADDLARQYEARLRS